MSKQESEFNFYIDYLDKKVRVHNFFTAANSEPEALKLLSDEVDEFEVIRIHQSYRQEWEKEPLTFSSIIKAITIYFQIAWWKVWGYELEERYKRLKIVFAVSLVLLIIFIIG